MSRKACRFLIVFLPALLNVVWASAQGQSGEHAPEVVRAVRRDVSPPLRDIPRQPPIPQPDRVIPNAVEFLPPGKGGPPMSRDPLLDQGGAVGAEATPSLNITFEGLSDDDNAAVIGGRVVPPDTEGDVGLDHYVQMVNLIFAVYDKDTGGFVPGGEPRANSDLWSGFGGICETNNDGDPIVLYDHLADRWLFSQFAIGSEGHQCLAVSQTSDPLGPYFRYDFIVSTGIFAGFNDYPKIGVWPDGYYMTFNEFDQVFGFLGAAAVAFERDAMLNGQTAQGVKFGPLDCSTECFFSLQPSHLEGPAPPAGTPNTFVMAFDSEAWGTSGAPDGYRLWDFSVDWNNPSNSTFTSLGQVDTAEFDADLCGFAACVPQRDSSELLDTLSQFTMYRAQARDFGTHQSIVVNHTVDAGGDRAGIRWVELRKGGGGWFLEQTGTVAPNDGLHRWMGSLAMDSAGNIALGYSVSSADIFPEIRYTSRTAADPPGTMPGGEALFHAGGGSQSSSSNRWGDYSSMSVDPSDGCTFWYTQEYYATSGSFDFNTRIGSFKLAECGAVCGNGVIEGDEECDGDDLGGATCGDAGCLSGTVSCTEQCTIDFSQCSDCSLCDNDGVCEQGEDCSTCPNDCVSGTTSGAACGNGVCEAGDGEDCLSCPEDCNGKQNGKPDGRFCCGDGDGQNPVDCGDPKCTEGGFQCTSTPSEPGEFCCGDGVCSDGESCSNCALDCTEPAEICTDGIDNDCNGAVDCDDSACSDDPDCSSACVPTHNKEKGPRCSDGIDNDCDGLIDGDDPDC